MVDCGKWTHPSLEPNASRPVYLTAADPVLLGNRRDARSGRCDRLKVPVAPTCHRCLPAHTRCLPAHNSPERDPNQVYAARNPHAGPGWPLVGLPSAPVTMARSRSRSIIAPSCSARSACPALPSGAWKGPTSVTMSGSQAIASVAPSRRDPCSRSHGTCTARHDPVTSKNEWVSSTCCRAPGDAPQQGTAADEDDWPARASPGETPWSRGQI